MYHVKEAVVSCITTGEAAAVRAEKYGCPRDMSQEWVGGKKKSKLSKAVLLLWCPARAAVTGDGTGLYQNPPE